MREKTTVKMHMRLLHIKKNYLGQLFKKLNVSLKIRKWQICLSTLLSS